MARILILLSTLVFLGVSPLKAAELIMFEQHGCHWCEQWNEDIGVVYFKTEEGKRAPLRRVDIHEKMPEDLKSITSGHFTPTFVLVDNGKEIGRIRGYPGESFFWGLLNQILAKLPQKTG